MYFICFQFKYFTLFFRYSSTTITTPPIKTNKVLRTSAKLNNNNNINDNTCIINSPSIGRKERSTRTNNGGSIVKKQKLNKDLKTADDDVKFGNSNSENEQLPREPWLLPSTKSIKSEKPKVGVVLRSSGRIPKSWKCNNSKEDSTPLKISTISKIKTPLTEPITRTLRSHKKRSSRRFKSIKSRSSWSAGVVTRSHRKKC